MPGLEVRSHVARDLLQSAGVFKNERMVTWEYVSNSLDYVDQGVSPVVRVTLDRKSKTIAIADNGRGMDWQGLGNFFLMHGENLDRKAGRPGRGRFGTGKSAAFGIGDSLRITTTQGGKRSTVELSRTAVESLADGAPIPVEELEREVATDAPNGTTVTVSGIKLASLDQEGVIHFIERHLAHLPRDVSVFVNKHKCQYVEPPVEKSYSFQPLVDASDPLEGVELVIKVSKTPLDKELRGIAISASGVWHECTLLGAEGKPMSEFIFGEIDVPLLESDTSVPPAFDLSRSMTLNPENPLVQSIHSFVGPKIEQVLQDLQTEHKLRKSAEDAKRLQKEAGKIEEIINQDFDSFRKKIQKIRTEAGQGFDNGPEASGAGADGADDDFIYGGDQPATTTDQEGGVGTDGGGDGTASDDGQPRRLNPVVQPDPGGSTGAKKVESTKARPSRGGFSVEFANQGSESKRATYQSEKRTIYVNLDHPQIETALNGRDPEDPVFRRLAYEVAFSEYAIALASELDNRGEFLEPSDSIVEIRDAINRIAVSAAQLYA
jgi:hypothetical protein